MVISGDDVQYIKALVKHYGLKMIVSNVAVTCIVAHNNTCGYFCTYASRLDISL